VREIPSGKNDRSARPEFGSKPHIIADGSEQSTYE